MKIFIPVILMCILPFTSIAGEFEYRCKILEAKQLDSDGNLTQTPWVKLNLGNEFSVSRDSGKVSSIPFLTPVSGEVTVLEQGSSQQSFKAITITKPFTSVNYICIEEFREGELKPFLGIVNNEIYTGVCR